MKYSIGGILSGSALFAMKKSLRDRYLYQFVETLINNSLSYKNGQFHHNCIIGCVPAAPPAYADHMTLDGE